VTQDLSNVTLAANDASDAPRATGQPLAQTSLFTAHAVSVATRSGDGDALSASTRLTASIETVDNDHSVLSRSADAFS
jgi:hypothetical protein